MTSIKKQRTELTITTTTSNTQSKSKNSGENFYDKNLLKKIQLKHEEEVEEPDTSVVYSDTEKFIALLEDGDVSNKFLDQISRQQSDTKTKIV